MLHECFVGAFFNGALAKVVGGIANTSQLSIKSVVMKKTSGLTLESMSCGFFLGEIWAGLIDLGLLLPI